MIRVTLKESFFFKREGRKQQKKIWKKILQLKTNTEEDFPYILLCENTKQSICPMITVPPKKKTSENEKIVNKRKKLQQNLTSSRQYRRKLTTYFT